MSLITLCRLLHARERLAAVTLVVLSLARQKQEIPFKIASVVKCEFLASCLLGIFSLYPGHLVKEAVTGGVTGKGANSAGNSPQGCQRSD